MMMAAGKLRVWGKLARRSFNLDVDFDVVPGETFVLVGPSGSGKSSCLSAIAGLLRFEKGRVSLGERLWCDTEARIDEPPHRRRVGYVPQDFALFPHLTVRENVLFGARSRGLESAAATRRANEWLDKLGIRLLAGQSVRNLSGGERQRCALARALTSDAEVLLLDEPFGSLDASTRSTVRRQLGEFLREVRLPTVLVTHDPADALALGDRIAILEQGHIVQSGTSDDLLARPRTAFVAELFGINFYRAELAAGSGLREAVVGDNVFHVTGGSALGAVILAFPPSAVTLSAQKPEGSAQNVFRGRIKEVVPLLERARVVIDCGVTMVAEVVREGITPLGLRRGGEIWASVKATAIRVYPQ